MTMKEEWKVYIKGVPNRGNEVIKALIDLGAKESFYTTSASGSNENFIHFINHKGEIDYVSLDTEQAQIIMDNYKEIKLSKQILKDGDILINKDNTEYTIIKARVYDNVYFTYNFSIRKDKQNFKWYEMYRSNATIYQGENFRLATLKEIKQFHNILHKIHKDWDAEKKQLVDWKWKPKNEEDYWTIIVGITIYMRRLTWTGSAADEIRYELGNCFRTSDEADAMLKKVKLLFNKE